LCFVFGAGWVASLRKGETNSTRQACLGKYLSPDCALYGRRCPAGFFFFFGENFCSTPDQALIVGRARIWFWYPLFHVF
jgi:hypothetical protein